MTCIHHWLCEWAPANMVEMTCKHCGKVKLVENKETMSDFELSQMQTATVETRAEYDQRRYNNIRQAHARRREMRQARSLVF